jgi:hypothetical protein
VIIAGINQSTPFYGFICLIPCTVHTKWICTRPYVFTQGYLFLFEYFPCLIGQGPLGFLQNYLVLIIVICTDRTWLNKRSGGSRRFICVEHNRKKNDPFSPGVPLDLSIEVWWCLSLFLLFCFDFLWRLVFNFKLCHFLDFKVYFKSPLSGTVYSGYL